MTPECKDLIESLLNEDYKNRLGSKGIEEIKNHAFLKGFFKYIFNL